MDNNKEVLIDLKRYKIYWIVMLILFLIFSIVVVRSINNANEKEIAKIEEANKKAERRELEATIKADSATKESRMLFNKVSGLEDQLSSQTKLLNKIESGYNKSLNELIKIKDEKVYIPNNVSSTEQFKFISDYKYSEY